MHLVKKVLKSKKGEIYIEYLIGILIVLSITVGVVNGIFVLQQKKVLDNAAIELTRCIQLNGQLTDDFNIMFEALTEKMEVKPTYSIETKYISGTDKIQLGTTIILTLKQDTTWLALSLEIRSKGVGNSEVYFKN